MTTPASHLMAKVRVHKGFILCECLFPSSVQDKVLVAPDNTAVLVFDTEKNLGISSEAMELLKTLKRSEDEVGHVDWATDKAGRSYFFWLGSVRTLVDPEVCQTAAPFVASDKFVVIDNDVSKEAMSAVDQALANKEIDRQMELAAKPMWSSEAKE